MSSHSRPDAELTIRALELGAVDFITKPESTSSRRIQDLAGEIRLKLLSAARMRPRGLDAERMAWDFEPASWPKKPAHAGPSRMCRKTVSIGISTGGPSALKTVVRALPPDLAAAVLIVQHMPAGFTRALAERLNELSPAVVKEAEDGETLCAGRVYLARGGFHLCVEPEGRHAVARLNRKARVSFFRPSIDVLMRSAADVFRERHVGVIMTGMSADGVAGIRAVKERGGVAIAQDEATSAIFGMNRLAIETGLVDHVVPLDRIVPTILNVL
jgi:two-component system chemotaxis response regulator CheB